MQNSVNSIQRKDVDTEYRERQKATSYYGGRERLTGARATCPYDDMAGAPGEAFQYGRSVIIRKQVDDESAIGIWSR